MHSALIGLFLLAQTPDVPDVGQRVVAELRNGYRIEGVLVEKDGRYAVLSLESGELRLDLKRVLCFHSPGSAPKPGKTGDVTPHDHRLSIRASAVEDGDRLLSITVPESWKKAESASEALTYVDPAGELRFRVEEDSELQSLWKITARIRHAWKDGLTNFEVKQERFGNRWTEVRTWEIDFEYREGEERYRERRLYLDLGRTKRIFSFRARASSFSGLVGHFERIVSGMTFEISTPALEESGAAPPQGDQTDAPAEGIENALETRPGQEPED